MPFLNRISDTKALYLVAYKLNVENALALADALGDLVPALLRKLVLIDNSLKDSSVSAIFDKLAEGRGGGVRGMVLV